jgi:hypothetical protein
VAVDGVKCIDCAKINLRDNPKHAKTGMGTCPHEQIQIDGVQYGGVFTSIHSERNCEHYRAADGETVVKRLEWWNNRHKGK